MNLKKFDKKLSKMDKANDRKLALIAFEAGYKAREMGKNIQLAKAEFIKLMKECGL